ncbi:metallophosphoesterase [Novosphingobium sp. Fuku2-ISO-50]|uniref:metallophosphoesterase n=1 Tax=Novosphingobium sp. Fuku2-ISO-50 TaxID=1739114 RepID=UPI0009E83F22|nr:metallophosphoesterase [Novosphingobium sp. Fuku2-ISO-50]
MRLLHRPILAALLLTLIAVLAYGWHEARSDPIVRRAQITLVGGDPKARPLRIALVSDIHVSNLAMPISRLDRIVDQINAEHPDAVLIAGDFVNGTGADSWDFHPRDIIAPLSRLRAPLGVIAVLGNHDTDTSRPEVEAALRAAGITLLSDQVARIGPIALIGMDMLSVRKYRIAPVLARAREMGGFPVLMTHAPPFSWQVSQEIPLILAGHSHCGQIVFPGWDNSFDVLAWRLRFPPHLRCGIAHVERQTVIVTGGVGAATIPPIRLGAPPDFWMLTLTGAPLPPISAPINAPKGRQIHPGSSR